MKIYGVNFVRKQNPEFTMKAQYQPFTETGVCLETWVKFKGEESSVRVMRIFDENLKEVKNPYKFYPSQQFSIETVWYLHNHLTNRQ